MNQLALPVNEKRMESPEGLMQAALLWIQENPEAADFLVGAAQRDALDGVPVRFKWYAEMLRSGYVYDEHGQLVMRKRIPLTALHRNIVFPNALTAALARIFCEWHPELRASTKLAASKLDGCVIPPRTR